MAVAPWRGYAVADPDDGSRLTFWWADDGGALHRWPPGTRWEPMPPRFTGPDPVGQRDEWYLDVYWPWKQAVAEAIEADPARAAARFAVWYPGAKFPGEGAASRRAESEREAQRRRYEEVTAAAQARRGASVRKVAGELGVAWATARARIAAGERILAEDPDGARRAIVDYLRHVLADDSAEQLAARVLAGVDG